MGALRFAPRILFLSTDPARVRAQLGGAALTLAQAAPLRDDVSTDEITPLPVMVHFDATLGRYPYLGFKAGNEMPIGRDAIRDCRHRGRGRRQALRQGLVARAQRGRRAGRRRAPGDRRKLRAHLSPERGQRRPADLDRLRPDRPHPRRRGDRPRGPARRPRRPRSEHRAPRRLAEVRPGAHDGRRPRGGADRADRRRCSARSWRATRSPRPTRRRR